MAQKKSQAKKRWLAAALLAVLAIVLIAALEFTDTTHLFHKAIPPAKVIVAAGTKPAGQDKPKQSSGLTEKKLTSGNGINQGTATDNQGGASATPESQWLVAKSGDITLKQPAANATLKDGAVISGSAKVSQVQYRLIDDQVGLLAQGSLKAVNGNFSGTLHFQPHSSGGRLDIFSYDASDAEINEIQVIVRY